MARQTLAWHQQCLDNFRCSLERKKEELKRLVVEVERMEKEAGFRQEQLHKAIAQGKDSYDEDRFCVKK